MEEKRNKKSIIAVCLLVLSLVLITVGTTFAFFQYSRKGTTTNNIETGTLTFIYDESKSKDGGVSIDNAFPMSDSEGKALDKSKSGVFDFDVKAETEGAVINYEIYLTKEKESTLPEYTVKTYLTTISNDVDSEITTGLPTKTNLNLYSALYDSQVPTILSKPEITGKTLYRETIPDGQENYTKTFRYRMWIDEDADKVIDGSWKYNSKTFSVKVNVYAQNDTITAPTAPEVYKDESGANYPDLVEGLIPVRYDTNKKSWVKADLYKEWYDYNNQEWANAVTVKETMDDNGSHNRDYYMEAKAGEIIDIDDINTMWVWIPRYEYDYINIQTAGGQKETCTYEDRDYNCYLNPGEIKINFINQTEKQVSNANYKIHPAFTFGEEELTGYWYGKFETGSTINCVPTTLGATNCNSDTLIATIKPNVTSWRGLGIANMFYAARNMQTNNYNIYGFPNNDTYDIHMSKNSEWGGVAYLSQSKYGKYGLDEQEIKINSCSQFITGNAVCGESYETSSGVLTSTTGTVYGIYDMNGGATEYVMGVASDDQGQPILKSFNSSVESGKTLPTSKYYDLYKGNDTGHDSTTACDGGVCYGHALSETAGWYGDIPFFLSSGSPWLHRGYDYSGFIVSGIFESGYYVGGYHYTYSFRIVLAP